MAYLDPNNHWPFKNSLYELTQQSGISDTAKKASLPKAPCLDSKALSVERRLGLQLDTTLLYMPVMLLGEKEIHVCQLHRWEINERYGQNEIPCMALQNVMRCKACAVSICQWYWEFHTKCDLNTKH